MPDIQARIVGAHRADTRQHDATARAPVVAIGARLRPGNPLRNAIGKRRLAIERCRNLEPHIGHATGHTGYKTGVDLQRIIGADADGHLDPGRLQRLQATARHARVGIKMRKYHPGGVRLDEGIHTGRCAPVMAAGLQGYIDSRALGSEALAFEIPQRHDLGVRSAHMLRGTPREHLTITRNHTAHTRIRRRHV